jgi:hypothetical protein
MIDDWVDASNAVRAVDVFVDALELRDPGFDSATPAATGRPGYRARLDKNPDAMRTRRETVEHPFGTLKKRMGATHFLMKTLPKVTTEMALHVLAYNLTRVMNIVGIKPFIAAIRA